MKKKIALLSIGAITIVIALIISVIGNPIVYSNNKNLKESILSLEEVDFVSLNNIVPFYWDEVYTFDPYTPKSEIEDIIVARSSAIKETVSEGMLQLIFVKNQEVVSSVYGYVNNLGYSINFITGSGSYQKISYVENAMFSVMRDSGIVWLTYIK